MKTNLITINLQQDAKYALVESRKDFLAFSLLENMANDMQVCTYGSYHFEIQVHER